MGKSCAALALPSLKDAFEEEERYEHPYFSAHTVLFMVHDFLSSSPSGGVRCQLHFTDEETGFQEVTELGHMTQPLVGNLRTQSLKALCGKCSRSSVYVCQAHSLVLVSAPAGSVQLFLSHRWVY